VASSLAQTKGNAEKILVMTIVLAGVTFFVTRGTDISQGIAGAGNTVTKLFKGAAGT
jgi:hypothetical protein